MRRIWIALAATSVVASVGCRRAPERPAVRDAAKQSAETKPRIEILRASITREDLQKLPLEQARQRLDEFYQLIPDQRFLYALAELESLLGRRPSLSLRLERDRDVWRIAIGDEVIARFPDEAGFDSMFEEVTRRAREALAPLPDGPALPPDSRAAIERALADPSPERLVSAFPPIEKSWAPKPDPLLARSAAQAYLWLCVQSLDGMEMADALYGRAIAVQAISAAMGGESTANTALLASLMGYGQDARGIAAGLPAENAIRLFVMEETSRLLARAGDGDTSVRYLALLALSNSDQEVQWAKWLQSHFPDAGASLPILRAASGLTRFENETEWAQAVMQASLDGVGAVLPQPLREVPPSGSGLLEDLIQEIAARATNLDSRPAGVLREFETALERRCSSAAGKLWDGWACRAYWRAQFYAGLDVLGTYYVDSLASGPAATGFSEYLKDAPSTGPADQFQKWYARLAAVRSGVGIGDSLDELEAIPDLGGRAASRLFRAFYEYFAWKPFMAAEGVRRLARQLDARPAHRAILLSANIRSLMDMRRIEALCRRSGLEGGHGNDLTGLSWSLWCTRFLEGPRKLLQRIDSAHVPVEERAGALHQLSLHLEPPEVKKRFRSLLREARFANSVAGPHLGFLLHFHMDYKELEFLARGWLANHEQERGTLGYAVYRGRLARALSGQGHHTQAWQIIEPLLATGQGNIMVWGANILDQLGRSEEALNLARAAMERYPDLPSRGDLAGLLWKHGRYSEAADILAPTGVTIMPAAWKPIGESFRDGFEGKEDAEVLRALEALHGQRIQNIYLDKFLEPIAEKRPDLICRVMAEDSRRRGEDLLQLRLSAYRCLKKTKPPAEAIASLRASFPTGMRDAAAIEFFRQREYELLWDVIEPPPGSELSDFSWLLRAAASLLSPRTEDRQRRLMEHYASSFPTRVHHTLGRHLLGLEDVGAVERAATDVQARSDAAFAFGYRAIAQEDYPQASDWLHLAVLISHQDSWAQRLSWVQLGRWFAEAESLDRLARRRLY